MKVLFYITQFNQVKDATKFYLEVISEALTGSSDLKMVNNLKEVNSVDYVVTFTVTDFFRLKTRKPLVKVIHWFQGILPEEILLKEKNKKKYYAFGLLERFVLKASYVNFFVSDAMRMHFIKKYSYNKNNFIIMPCFNGILKSKKDFINKKKLKDKFVYIGSLAKWQCVDDLLLLFKEIKKNKPNAELTILTGEQEKAKNLCKKYNVNATVDYVSLDKIASKLLEFNYGFLLREDHIVNRVATPTKMSTYLASGVIPIYSDVIEDFKVLNEITYKVKVKPQPQKDNVLREIEKIDEDIDMENLFREYHKIFDEYYNSSSYIRKIREHELFHNFK
ncbi:hypothetical protein [Mesonia aestuariivivens]|uniref:Glycosyltransferase n=1 Tax=Mesonia aestuariivivens TaxID=2796128 RepID=A0ABS6W1W3_9FLAO|nr:hypothetical protein [Mesonia aestuariivivens]MBW2961526.1 hypothetical protein [Mesonia aestuariivivens]